MGRDVNTHHQDAAAAIDAAAAPAWVALPGGSYLAAPSARGGPALSLQLQWNNYDWCAETSSQEYLLYYLFSQSPGSGGENAYKLAGSPARLLTPAAVCSGADSPLRSLSFRLFFSPPAFFLHSLVFFLFVLLLLFFFFLVAFQAAAQRWSISTTGPQHSCGRTLPAPSVFTLFFYYLLFFCFFWGEQRPLFFPFEAKSAPDKISSLDSQCFFFFIIITIIIIAREEISEREQVLALMEQRDNAAWSSSEGELCVEHMSDIMGLIHRRKSRTPRRCRSGGRGERWVTTAASWERGREGGERGASHPLHHHRHNRWGRLLSGWAGANWCWLAGRALTRKEQQSKFGKKINKEFCSRMWEASCFYLKAKCCVAFNVYFIYF